MQGHTLVAMAATPMAATVRAITTEQLGAPTPCSEYDVRKLINHLLYWGPLLEGAAKDASVAAPAESELEVDLTRGDWSADLAAQIDRTATAWSEPQAWEGTTRLGSPSPVPAQLIGGMVLTEFVVHGWDLALATNRQQRWADEVLDYVYREVEMTADQGRQMGVYGPRVPVPDAAPLLDRILGLTGRDPVWPA
jgi:uncharacterized protein (TIGR03086 family)